MKFFRFVRHAEVPAYREKGWDIADTLQGTPHGFHAVLMIFQGEGEP